MKEKEITGLAKSTMPNFQVIELKYPHPQTSARFWIEWEVEKEVEYPVKRKGLANWVRKILGLEPLMTVEIKNELHWEIFNDPASTEINIGYKTIVEANHVIDRYRINRTPTIHKY